MTNPLNLSIIACLCALLTGCGEPVDRKQPARINKNAGQYSTSASRSEPDATIEFVAGLEPYQRPTSAPVIQEFVPSTDWRSRFMSGIDEPIPTNLDFIDSQGAWYTPFNQPGMPGYYDLRNLHQGSRHSNNAGR